MVLNEDLVPGRVYRVIENTTNHEFEIGQMVRFLEDDGDFTHHLICEYLDGHDFWYMNEEDLEEV